MICCIPFSVHIFSLENHNECDDGICFHLFICSIQCCAPLKGCGCAAERRPHVPSCSEEGWGTIPRKKKKVETGNVWGLTKTLRAGSDNKSNWNPSRWKACFMFCCTGFIWQGYERWPPWEEARGCPMLYTAASSQPHYRPTAGHS